MSRMVFKMALITYVISIFFVNCVTMKHCEFSGEDDTDEEFPGFEVLCSLEDVRKSENKTQTIFPDGNIEHAIARNT